MFTLEGNPYTIYALRDPYDLRARYIGMTRDPEKRLKQHLACDGSNPEKDSWIRERHKMDHEIIMETIEIVYNLKLAREREDYWIRYHHARSIEFYNKTLLDARNESIEERIRERNRRFFSVVLDLPKNHALTQRMLHEADEMEITLRALIKQIIVDHYKNKPMSE